MIGKGSFYLVKPPKYFNWRYGYCTKRSVQSQETWQYAQRCCGKTWCLWGGVQMTAALLVMLWLKGQDDGIVELTGVFLCTLECGVMLLASKPTERKLERKFG